MGLFVSGGTKMTDGAFVECLGLLQAGHAARRECLDGLPRGGQRFVSRRLDHTFFLLIGGAVAVGGCVFFDSPIDLTPQLGVDAALLGTWRGLPSDPDADAEPANFVVTVARDRVYAITFEEKDEEPHRYEAHASEIGTQVILNVRDLDTRFPDKPWAFARYSFLLPNVVRVELVDDESLKEVEQSPATLRNAIERLDGSAGLYADFCICVRATS